MCFNCDDDGGGGGSVVTYDWSIVPLHNNGMLQAGDFDDVMTTSADGAVLVIEPDLVFGALEVDEYFSVTVRGKPQRFE